MLFLPEWCQVTAIVWLLPESSKKLIWLKFAPHITPESISTRSRQGLLSYQHRGEEDMTSCTGHPQIPTEHTLLDMEHCIEGHLESNWKWTTAIKMLFTSERRLKSTGLGGGAPVYMHLLPSSKTQVQSPQSPPAGERVHKCWIRAAEQQVSVSSFFSLPMPFEHFAVSI